MTSHSASIYSQTQPNPRDFNGNIEHASNDSDWLKRMSLLLRSLGAIAVLIALYSFLIKGWVGSSDVVRYLTLLGHTVLLSVISLIIGHFLKEGKSPRVLMMLALTSVTINFTILGSFIFSTTDYASAKDYPHHLTLSIDSLISAITLSIGSITLLIPVIILGFRTLIRGVSVPMTIFFIVANSALLLPFRDSTSVALIGIILATASIIFHMKTTHHSIERKTFEGFIAITLLFLPLAILIGRHWWLYNPDSMMTLATLAILFITTRQCSIVLDQNNLLRILLEFFSVIFAIGVGISLTITLLLSDVANSFSALAGIFACSGLIYEMSQRAPARTRFYRLLSTLMLTTGLLVSLADIGGIAISLTMLVSGLVLLFGSYLWGQKSVLLFGVINTLLGAIYQFTHVINSYDISYLVTLGVGGVFTILIASLLESKGHLVKQKIISLQKSYKDW